MKKSISILAGITAMAAASSAMAGTDFVIQNPDQINGLFADSTGSSPNQRVADNFVSEASWSLEYISFWGGYFPINTPVVDSFTIEFYADVAGLPGGTAVHTTTLTNLVRTDTGIDIFGVDEYRYDADFAAPVNLGAGTFWISITNNTGFGANGSWFWETSSGGGNSSSWSPDGGTTWNVQPNGLSMILGGVIPAPGAIALLGLAGIAAPRRRRSA